MFIPRNVDFKVESAFVPRDYAPLMNALTIADGDPDYEAPRLNELEALQLFANVAKVE